MKKALALILCLAALAPAIQAEERMHEGKLLKAYTWYENGKAKQVWLDPELVVEFPATRGRPPQPKEATAAARQTAAATADATSVAPTSPVLRDVPGGPIRALPGNVIVRLNPQWDEPQVRDWLAGRNLDRVAVLPFGRNIIVVKASPGLAALELANELQLSGEVVAAEPEWWQPREAR